MRVKHEQAVVPVVAFAVFAMASGSGAALWRINRPTLPIRAPLATSRSNASVRSASVPLMAVRREALQASTPLPLAFEPNQGQTDARVRYVSRGPGFTAFLTDDGAVLKWKGPEPRGTNSQGRAQVRSSKAGFAELGVGLRRTEKGEPRTTESILRMQLIRANEEAVATGIDELPGKTNYFRGQDPRKWHTNIANYARVRYENIYPGVNLLYYGNQGRLEYDFEVKPGTEPGIIRLRFPGAQQVHVDKATDDLLVRAGRSDVRFHRPVVYQTDDRGGKSYLAGRYVLDASRHSVGFRVSRYDQRRTLVIDPTLSYSTYLGGSQDDEGTALAVDSSGDVFVAGLTDSVDFPVTSGAFQTACGGGCSSSTYDAFVTRLNPTGSELIYSTYLGGSQTDEGEGLVISPGGLAYVTGITYSSDFPVTNGAFQTSCAGGSCAHGEGFVTELNATGSALVYSTYLGGSDFTQANALALNKSGDVYVTGWTNASDFPTTPGVFQTQCGAGCMGGNSAGFVVKLNPRGSALVYSTYLGGSSRQEAYALALDAAGDAYVAGYTASTDFPTTPGAFQTSIAAPEAGFVAKLNPTASALVYSTYVGGSGTGSNPCAACAAGITVDNAGEAYVSGLTWETDFPVTAGAFQTAYAGGFHDAFLVKLNAAGSALVYSTYLGGSEDDGAVAVALDSAGQLYVRGNTFSKDFPTTAGAFQTVEGGSSDVFFTILNPAGSSLIYSTYLGGSGHEFGHATRSMVLDTREPPSAYLTGYTSSSDFPVTSGAFQTVFGGVYDAFVSKFAPSPNVGLSPSSLVFGNQAIGTTSPPQDVTLTNTGTSTLNISGASITGSDPTNFNEIDNCRSSLAAQATCTLKVTFKPTATGTRTAALSIADNAPGSPQSVGLSGSSGGPKVSLSPASLTFPTQVLNTASTAQTVTVGATEQK